MGRKRVIYSNDGRIWGVIGEFDANGKRVIRDEDGIQIAELEESMVPGKEIIYSMDGKEIGEIDNYTGREIFYDRSGREQGEVKYESKDDITFADLAEPVARPVIEGFIGLFNPARLYEAMASVVVGFGFRLMLLAGGIGLLALGLMVFGNIQGAAPKVEDFWFVWNWQDAMSAYFVSRIAELLGSFSAMFLGLILLTTGFLAGSSSEEEKKVGSSSEETRGWGARREKRPRGREGV